jgi:epoxyqueuosine reductase
LTIELREPVPRDLREGIGDWLFGCDICQEVCPHNSARPSPARRLDAYEPVSDHAGQPRHTFDLLDVLGWTEQDRRGAFTASALKRATLAMMKRNALIVAANHLARHSLPALRARIEQIARDDTEPTMVTETARGVLARLDA